jgi:biopolymer transport protein ExbB/TolQ
MVVLFVAAVFVSTANMHDVAILLPRVPVQGWPLAGEFHAPLFMVILTSLVIGVVITGLVTLFEQIRLRTVARRARKERERAMAALAPTESARDIALQEQTKLREELRLANAALEQVRGERDEAVQAKDAVRAERDSALEAAERARRERDEARAGAERAKIESAQTQPAASPDEGS